MSSLNVRLNGGDGNVIDAPAEHAVSESFFVVFENEGGSVRANLRFDDRLDAVTQIGDASPLVESGGTRRVRVELADVDETVTGTLTIGVGYGAEEETVEITASPYPGGKDPVDVDETLSRPNRTESQPSPLSAYVDDPTTAGLVALAVLAVLVAVGLVIAVNSLPVLAGALVVLVAVVGAVAWAVR